MEQRCRMNHVKSYLRHPVIGFVFRSCIVNPHRPIDANIHATNNNMMSINNLIGTTSIEKIAVCGMEEARDRRKKNKMKNTLLLLKWTELLIDLMNNKFWYIRNSIDVSNVGKLESCLNRLCSTPLEIRTYLFGEFIYFDCGYSIMSVIFNGILGKCAHLIALHNESRTNLLSKLL